MRAPVGEIPQKEPDPALTWRRRLALPHALLGQPRTWRSRASGGCGARKSDSQVPKGGAWLPRGQSCAMRSARTSLAQGRPLRALVLAVLLLDSLGEDFMFHPEWGFDAYEITIPKKLSVRGGAQGASKLVAYLLQVKGKKHVLHLWPKRFLLPRHLQVFSFTEQGQHLEDYPYIPRDCNYVGAVEGSGDSEATVSTCMGGLRGILRIDAKHYQIEPLKASSTFEHVVYFLKDEGLHQPLCGLTKGEIEQQGAPYAGSARLGDLTGIIRHQRYLE